MIFRTPSWVVVERPLIPSSENQTVRFSDNQASCQTRASMSTRKSEPQRPILRGESRDERPNVGILLRGPLQEIVRRIAEGLVEAGFDDIRPAHTAVFQHVKAEGSRLSELAERAQITKQSMGYLVDYLEAHGYVERRADPSDRRASLIFLTERGWAEVREALRIIAAIEQEWARRMGQRRMEQLRELLTELNAGAGSRD
jgi:DNA-binding MarR family transcriptional regulator